MTQMKLTYGNEGFKEIRGFLKNNYFDNYTLSIFDTIKESTIEVTCTFEEMIDIIVYVTHVEHDFPAWIGVNELSESYVVGLAFTRGRLNSPAIYEWQSNGLLLLAEL